MAHRDRRSGSEGNLLDPTPERCRQIELPHARCSTTRSWRRIRAPRRRPRARGFGPSRCPALFRVARRRGGPAQGHRGHPRQAVEAIDARAQPPHPLRPRRDERRRARSRRCSRSRPCTTTCVREGTRTAASASSSRSGEPREVHHFALLIGYGASAVNPYLALRDASTTMIRHGLLAGVDRRTAEQNYVKAAQQGRRQGALARWASPPSRATAAPRSSRPSACTRTVIDEYFTWHRHRASAASASTWSPSEVQARHYARLPRRAGQRTRTLDRGGQYQWRARRRVRTSSTRETVHRLQHACRTGSYEHLQGVRRRSSNDQSEQLCHPARPAGLQARPRARAARRGRAGRVDREALQDRRHVATAPSRRRPTRRSPIAMNRIGGKSQHRRGRRGSRAATCPLPNGDSKNSRHQAGGLRPLRRHQRVPRRTPTSCRSRWPRAPSPARAASCPATRSIRGSPGRATPRRAWASSPRRRTTTSTPSRTWRS